MSAYFLYLRDRLRTSFWLIPSVMTLGAGGAAFLMLWIDSIPSSLRIVAWLDVWSSGEASARLVLSTIAGSMMTVASLVFSLTLVALTLAAGSIGPRLIDRFRDNRVNQIALGLFLATFVYSLFILRSITSADPPSVPHLSIAVAMAMGLTSFGWLIVFIHDLAKTIQVDHVIARVANELTTAFEQLGAQFPGAGPVAATEIRSGEPIKAGRSGYVQAVDAASLLDIADEHDVQIVMKRRAGHFLMSGTVLAEVIGLVDDELSAAIRKAVLLGPKRTATQDTEFSVDLIVEIAARALSPGINDFYTAVACVDHLGAALDEALTHGLPESGYRDEAGRLRLVLEPFTIESLLSTAFDPLRQTACDSVPVALRLLECLGMLIENHRNPAVRALLAEHADLIHRTALAKTENDRDRRALDDRHASLKAALEGEEARTQRSRQPIAPPLKLAEP